MMQRICPVCDQVMKHAHYCSACPFLGEGPDVYECDLLSE